MNGPKKTGRSQRRRPALKLGLALQIGFLRMSGRVLDAVRVVPAQMTAWKVQNVIYQGCRH